MPLPMDAAVFNVPREAFTPWAAAFLAATLMPSLAPVVPILPRPIMKPPFIVSMAARVKGRPLPTKSFQKPFAVNNRWKKFSFLASSV